MSAETWGFVIETAPHVFKVTIGTMGGAGYADGIENSRMIAQGLMLREAITMAQAEDTDHGIYVQLLSDEKLIEALGL